MGDQVIKLSLLVEKKTSSGQPFADYPPKEIWTYMDLHSMKTDIFYYQIKTQPVRFVAAIMLHTSHLSHIKRFH